VCARHTYNARESNIYNCKLWAQADRIAGHIFVATSHLCSHHVIAAESTSWFLQLQCMPSGVPSDDVGLAADRASRRECGARFLRAVGLQGGNVEAARRPVRRDLLSVQTWIGICTGTFDVFIGMGSIGIGIGFAPFAQIRRHRPRTIAIATTSRARLPIGSPGIG